MPDKIRIREKTEKWIRWEIYNLQYDAELYDQFRILILEGEDKIYRGEYTWQSKNPAPNTWFERDDLKPGVLYEAHGFATWDGIEYRCGIIRGHTKSTVDFKHKPMWFAEDNILKNPYAEEGLVNWTSSGVSVQEGGIRRSNEEAPYNHFRLGSTAYMKQTFKKENFTDSKWAIENLLARFFFKFDTSPEPLETQVRAYAKITYKYQELLTEEGTGTTSDHKTRITNIGETSITWEIFDLQYEAHLYDKFRFVIVNEDSGEYLGSWNVLPPDPPGKGEEPVYEVDLTHATLETDTRYTCYTYATWNGVEYSAGSATGTTGGEDEGMGLPEVDKDIIILPINPSFFNTRETEEDWIKLEQVCYVDNTKELIEAEFEIRTVGITGYLRVDGFALYEGLFESEEDALRRGALSQTGVGTNAHLVYDEWGINPDFIKRFPNKCVGSGFEWYNPHTLRPYFWITDGRVTEASNWEGTVALQLNPGETAEQGNLYPIHRGVEAGANPFWWDNYRTRVSFKHKGGAVKVSVRPYPSQHWAWDASESPTWHRPDSGSSGWFSYAQCTNDEIICSWGSGGSIVQSWSQDLFTFMSTSNQLVDHTDVISGMGLPNDSNRMRSTVFNDKNGNLCLALCRSNDISEEEQMATYGAYSSNFRRHRVEIYKSASGNGRDEEGNLDWVYHGLVWETDRREIYVMSSSNNVDLGAALILPSGRWVISFPEMRGATSPTSSGNLAARNAVATSDDGGVSWTLRYSHGAWFGVWAYGHSRTLAYYGGRVWYVHSGNVTGTYTMYSNDEGTNWHSAYNSGWRAALYVFDGYLWSIDRAGAIRRTTNPMSFDSWEYIAGGPGTGSHDAFTAYFSYEQERVWSGRHHILGLHIVEDEAYTIIDNSEEGMHNKYGQEVGQIKEGKSIDYDYVENWAYIEPTAPEDPTIPYLVTGYRTFYFYPIVGKGRVKIEFENIDENEPCYLDAVQIEPDFSGKWPSIYSPGPRSQSPDDIIGMPGVFTAEWTEEEGSADGMPDPHAHTHAISGQDPLIPENIGAETPTGAQEKVDQSLSDAKNYAEEYTDQEIQALKFTDLPDTPSSYIGHAGKIVSVNEDGNALLFSEHAGLNITVRSFDIMSRGGIGGEAPTIDIVNTVYGWKMDIGEAFYIAGEID